MPLGIKFLPDSGQQTASKLYNPESREPTVLFPSPSSFPWFSYSTRAVVISSGALWWKMQTIPEPRGLRAEQPPDSESPSSSVLLSSVVPAIDPGGVEHFLSLVQVTLASALISRSLIIALQSLAKVLLVSAQLPGESV